MMEPDLTLRLPHLDELNPILEPLKGQRAWVVPMTGRSGKLLGNNGDALMHAVFLRILDAYSIIPAKNKDDAELVIVPPSGALLESYGFPDLLAERLRGAEHIPLVIFPSSALFPTRDPSFIFSQRTASSVWMLRERPSLDHLMAQWGPSLAASGVELVLMHDVVALGHEFVPDLIGQRRADVKTMLIAPRADRERTSAIATSAPKGRLASRLGMLSSLAQETAVGRRLIRRMRRTRTRALADRLIGRLGDDVFSSLELKTRRRLQLDLSSTQFCSFKEYAGALRTAEVVITDRLHVALPAAILGADVYIAEAGYHKLSGVYENSMSEMRNVHLVG